MKPRHRTTRPRPRRALSAFSLMDLAGMMAALGLLAATQAPAVINSQTAAERAVCLSNHRKLAHAWLAYAEDNGGGLAGNTDGTGATNRTWCAGWLELDIPVADNTNTALMLASQLGPYTRSAEIYKCPADRSVGPVPGGAKLPRVRSVSMNSYLGNPGNPSSAYTAGYRQFVNLSEIVEPSPRQALVFLDEREDSINDGWFAIDMNGYDPRNPESYVIVDYPADWHNRAGNVSFADGHAESHRWKDPRTMPPHRFGVELALGQPSPGNRDVAWIQERASRKNF